MPPAFAELPGPPPAVPAFWVSSQNVLLDVDFLLRAVKGKTEITVIPRARDIRYIRLNCRQTIITEVIVEGKKADFLYQDPYDRLALSSSSSVHSHQRLQQKIGGALKPRPDQELVIKIPWGVQIQELDQSSDAAQELLLAKSSFAIKAEDEEAAANLEAPALRAVADQGPLFTPLKIAIEFITEEMRDGLQFIGLDGDARYPHVYTRNSIFPGNACCLFPCVDELSSRCPWTVSIRCPRTIGDAFKSSRAASVNGVNGYGKYGHSTNGLTNGVHADELDFGFTDEEKALDLVVVCSGETTDEIVDPNDPSRKTVSFQCKSRVSVRHIGFAIGPFEYVDLSEYRESDEDVNLGDQAIRLHGYCLPGRAEEVKHSCEPMAAAADFLAKTFTAYPFLDYKMCFVDDLVSDVAQTASLSICSSRLLYAKDILDPQDSVTRILVHALASQWAGVNIVPRELTDAWVVVGCSYFMTDWFLKHLKGNNDFRYQLKLAKDQVFEMDVERPSIHALGEHLALDPGEMEFLAIKAPLVLFILHFRLYKQSGRIGVDRVIFRYFFNNKRDDDGNTGTMSTLDFLRTCEKVGHAKLDAFFKQWVYGAGCPHFYVQQRFNKKKLVIEMTIQQIHARRVIDQRLDPQSFRREVKEETYEVYAGELQPLFTGPMTIQIHEADGTPYEHIIEIKEVLTRFDIPYNTKYKRLKRSRRAKERAAAAQGLDLSGDAQDDVLLYCLGDVMQGEEEVRDWRLVDWTKEDEERMAQESYEWIRIDKDFEWISKISFGQPHYMWVSQLQQDTDVNAQMEAIQYLAEQKPFPMISTILVRTLMDPRYFYGIRIMAAETLVNCAKEELDWIGLYHLERAFSEFFCLPNSPMTRSNDFRNRVSYLIQCAIPRAISKVRDIAGHAPLRVKQFFVDKLKFNDNTNNEWSDCYYVAILMQCLGECLATGAAYNMRFDEDDEDEDPDEVVKKVAMDEIQRISRMDEWIPSYHNVLTLTALECHKGFAKSGLSRKDSALFMHYTRPGNSENVRIKAFSCLVELGFFSDPGVMRLLFYVFATDISPYVRDELWKLIWQGLGQAAIGVTKQEAEAAQQQMDGLIIEGGAEMTEARAKEIARTETVPGAISALKTEMGENELLKRALRNALTSESIGLLDFASIVAVCGLLYSADNSLKVVLKYSRYWKVEHGGHGKLTFSRSNKFRTKLPVKLDAPPAHSTKSSAASRAASPTLKRKNSTLQPSPSIQAPPMPPPSMIPISVLPPPPPQPPPPPIPPTPSEPPRKRRKLIAKLRLPSSTLATFPAGLNNAAPKPIHSTVAVYSPPAQSPPIAVSVPVTQSVINASPVKQLPPLLAAATTSTGTAASPTPPTPSDGRPKLKLKLKLGAPKT